MNKKLFEITNGITFGVFIAAVILNAAGAINELTLGNVYEASYLASAALACGYALVVFKRAAR